MASSPPSRESPSSGCDDSSLNPRPPIESDDLLEIPHTSASWSLSSAKPGNGIEQLLDSNPDTFWQSDGTQPHAITVQFFKKTKLTDVWLLFNYKADESYTPLQLSIRIGNGYYDLQEIQVIDLHEPQGWVRIPLALPPMEGPRILFKQDSASIRDRSFGGAIDFIRTFVIQVTIISNHQNGRDTHIRGFKLYGPKQERRIYLSDVVYESGVVEPGHRHLAFDSPEMLSMAFIR